VEIAEMIRAVEYRVRLVIGDEERGIDDDERRWIYRPDMYLEECFDESFLVCADG